MIHTVEELMQLLAAEKCVEHKHENLELKSDWAQDHGKKISMLANKSMQIAWLVIGVSDDGKILKKDESWAKKTEHSVSQHINSYLDPVQAIYTPIKCCEVNGGWLIIITIKNAGDVTRWNQSAYISSGSTICEMTGEQILELTFKLPGLIDYTKQNHADNHYDSIQVQIYLNRVAGHELLATAPTNVDAALNELKLKNTVAAHILFGDCKYRLVYFDRYNAPIRNETHCGLYGILTEDFIRNIQAWSKEQLLLAENPYPVKALKEALANAVAHAAYFEKDGEIIIELYPEKVVISNLCVPDAAYFANRWFSRGHRSVNVFLMEILRLSKITDQLGLGKTRIFSEYLSHGKTCPEVAITKAGRYNRWAIHLYGGSSDPRKLRLLDRLRTHYREERLALIANALVLWHDRSVSDIQQYVDKDSASLFLQVLNDLSGPVFYWEEKDKIVLNRWVKVLLNEGKDSKKLEPFEEEQLFKSALNFCTKHHGGYVTPEQLRKIADMGDTAGERVLISNLLKHWSQRALIEKVKKGRYKFVRNEEVKPTAVSLSALFQALDAVRIKET